ncbi:MAG: hypothetical protein FWG50_11570 [Kiritimatiellaeota bacterium]|nr:hypothetical protein [Kiritimatiellota bacterium]
MKKGDATHIRLDEYERERLSEISSVTGLPFSACIRVLIAAFIKDFEKNKGVIRFPLPMDASARIWDAIQEKYAIPSYVTSLAKLEKFLDLMQKHKTEKE